LTIHSPESLSNTAVVSISTALLPAQRRNMSQQVGTHRRSDICCEKHTDNIPTATQFKWYRNVISDYMRGVAETIVVYRTLSLQLKATLNIITLALKLK